MPLAQCAAAEARALSMERGQRDVRRRLADQRRRQFGRRALKQADIEQSREAQKNHNRDDEIQPLHLWLSALSPLSLSSSRTLLFARACACKEITTTATNT